MLLRKHLVAHRMDVLWGLLYLGIVSSLLPLCGIYDSYVSSAYGGGVISHLSWYLATMWYLLTSIFASGHVSALLVPATLLGLYQFADEQIGPKTRLFWGAGHGAAHVAAALTCLMFVEFAAEWASSVGLVSVSGGAAGGNATLATSMYEGYEANFASIFEGMVTGVDDAATAAAAAEQGDGSAADLLRRYVSRSLSLLSAAGVYAHTRFPLIQTIFEVR